MKQVEIPSRRQLTETYAALSWSDQPLSCGQIVLWSQWARLDARLAELLVAALAGGFKEINPFELWQLNKANPQPQVLLVLLEFSAFKARTRFPAEDRRAFNNWRKLISADIPTAAPQSFFILGGRPRPERDIKIAASSSAPFSRWGFFGNENLLPAKGKKNQATVLQKSVRLRILKILVMKRRPFSVGEYIAACAGRVHRRTAERDLRQFSSLRRRGYTQSRKYFPRSR